MGKTGKKGNAGSGVVLERAVVTVSEICGVGEVPTSPDIARLLRSIDVKTSMECTEVAGLVLKLRKN